MATQELSTRKFLFLQGPHGPFFPQLAELLASNGAQVSRIAFNAGDRFYWSKKLPRADFLAKNEAWPEFIAQYYEQNAITDIVLYAESRAKHQVAIKEARKRGIITHFFEEGYLRPYWVNYERGGVNGNSPLMKMSIDDIRKARAQRTINLEPAPAAWGNIWHHNWYGFTYHFQLWLGRNEFPNYQAHRDISLMREWQLNGQRLLLWPYRLIERDYLTKQFLKKERKFIVALLQLEHDASLRVHSDYQSQEIFIEDTIAAFARSAPDDLDLIFKLHPLEDMRVPLTTWITEKSKAHNVSDRVRYFFGGKLGELLDHARGAVTINSTASQQVLWRSLPLKIMGRSVFNKPEFVFEGSLDDFFARGASVDHQAFLEYRSYLLETSQIPGGFYSAKSRKSVLEHILPIMAAKSHAYDEIDKGN